MASHRFGGCFIRRSVVLQRNTVCGGLFQEHDLSFEPESYRTRRRNRLGTAREGPRIGRY
jgi:hypothetical protein